MRSRSLPFAFSFCCCSNIPSGSVGSKPLHHISQVAVLGLNVDVQVGLKALADHALEWSQVDGLVVVVVDPLLLLPVVSEWIV